MRIGFAELGRSAATSGRSPPGRGDTRQARDTTACSEHKELQLPNRQGRASQQQCGGRESQRRWRHRLTGNMRRQLPSRWGRKAVRKQKWRTRLCHGLWRPASLVSPMLTRSSRKMTSRDASGQPRSWSALWHRRPGGVPRLRDASILRARKSPRQGDTD